MNLLNLARILRCFHLTSGLKVNFSKSRVFGIGVQSSEVDGMAQILNCKPAALPFTYLGLSVGANMALCKNWKPVIERFQSKLSAWKSKSLSFGGRITLINSVLTSLPIFYFSLFKAPSSVIEDLDRIRRKFLWGGCSQASKICWISWDKVLTPKSKGGLGVINLRASNLSLLAKWLWRVKTDHDSLPAKLIMALHTRVSRWQTFPLEPELS